MNILKDGIPKEFIELLSKVGFSHITLRQHLNKPLGDGLVVRVKRPRTGPGRPMYVYSLPKGVDKRVASILSQSYMGLVVLSFEGLSRLCRHEKGGFCKEIRGGCAPQDYPRILK